MEEEEGSEETEEDQAMTCPDWTELTSTLEPFQAFDNSPTSRIGNLDTLLSSTSSNSAQPTSSFPNTQIQTQIQPLMAKVLQAKDMNALIVPSTSLDMDFFGDLNSSFDSLESSEAMIPFHEEDPFELVF